MVENLHGIEVGMVVRVVRNKSIPAHLYHSKRLSEFPCVVSRVSSWWIWVIPVQEMDKEEEERIEHGPFSKDEIAVSGKR